MRARSNRRAPSAAPPPAPDYDLGNIAVIQDRDGVVMRQNQFNLDSNTLTFTPSTAKATQYTYAVAAQGYDAAAAAAGAPLAALDDDDSRLVALPFALPYFGGSYTSVYVNSDGNLTFTAGDSASTQRSLGRMTAGPPRMSPLFDDLDPSKTAGGVRVFSDAGHVVISWVAVPEYASSGTGVPETFQVRLYPDGRIEFAYNGINPAIASAVVGISPGNLSGQTMLVDFRDDPSGAYSSTVAEVFSNALDIDIVTVAQRFYQLHEDAYDYLAIYNNMNIPAAGEGTIAFENTVRSSGTGYNVPPQDSGAEYGSAARLKSILQMGNLSQYPTDPTAIVAARAPQGDTPLTILTHETGHLFLAFASLPDGSVATGLPMLGFQLAHWSFLYDSEASVMEGERIVDRGPNVSPEFQTTDTVEGYSPLDQYLMGFLPSGSVPDTFYVDNPNPAWPATLHPYRGLTFDGTRVNVRVSDLIRSAGRRTPDYTVAQRHFRFAFILVAPTGVQPSAADVQQIDTYRQQFAPFYQQASGGNGSADTTLAHGLELSVFPAAGVVDGTSPSAAVTVATAPASNLTVTLSAPNGYAGVPASVTIPAGALTASFSITGLKPGVEDLQATPFGSSYATAYARIQVADAALLKLTAVSGTNQVAPSPGPLPQPVVVQLTDANNLAYAGARIVAAASSGGSVTPAAAVTDSRGLASFQWTPGSAPANQLHLSAEAFPAVSLTAQAGSTVPAIAAVVNSASFQSGFAPGALQTIAGVNLAGGQTAIAPYPWPASLGGVSVQLDGFTVPLLYVSDTQINFYAPATISTGPHLLTVTSPTGAQASAPVNAGTYQPGLFAVTGPDANGFLSIWCTGLGPTTPSGSLQGTSRLPTVFIGATPVTPSFSGLAPGYVGLYQVNAQVPTALAPGTYAILIAIDLAHSNTLNLTVP